MAPDPDELAGVVDLFGGLTREELRSALADLAARSGERFEDGETEDAIDRATDEFYLVPVESDGQTLLVAGPAALPRLPGDGEDLPHLVGIDPRSVDPGAAGEAALDRLRGAAARAVDAGDEERIDRLLDVCYDLEAWAPVETAAIRDHLDAAR